MKKLFYALIVFTAIGCSKDKPPTGTYSGKFNVDGHVIEVPDIMVTESGKDNLNMNGYTFQKDGRKICGVFDHLEPFSYAVEINGRWKKKQGAYIIEGDCTTTSERAIGPGEKEYSTTTGTFVIKSTF